MNLHCYPTPLPVELRREFTARNLPGRGVLIARLAPGVRTAEGALQALLEELTLTGRYRHPVHGEISPDRLLAAWIEAYNIHAVGVVGTEQLTPSEFDDLVDILAGYPVEAWLPDCHPRARWTSHSSGEYPTLTDGPAVPVSEHSWRGEVARYLATSPGGQPVPLEAARRWLGNDVPLVDRLRDVSPDMPESRLLELHADITGSQEHQDYRSARWDLLLRDSRPWANVATALTVMGLPARHISRLPATAVAPDGAWVEHEGFRRATNKFIAATIRAQLAWRGRLHELHPELAEATLLTAEYTSWGVSQITAHANGVIRAVASRWCGHTTGMADAHGLA